MDPTPAKFAVYPVGADNPERVELTVGTAALRAAAGFARAVSCNA